MSDKVIAFRADESYRNERGYLVVVAEKGQPGYQVWSEGWPTAFYAALEAETQNTLWGISPDQALEIFASSMAAGKVGQARKGEH